MARLTILEFPDPRLRTKAVPVEVVDDEIRQLAADMQETMYAAPGIGLAATQVDVHKRLLVLDELPRSSGGKVAKGELRRDIAARVAVEKERES